MSIILDINNSTSVLYKNSRANRIERAVNNIFRSSFDGVIRIHIIGSYAIRAINRKYRKKDKRTDVLSFPMYKIFFDSNKKILKINENDKCLKIFNKKTKETKKLEKSTKLDSSCVIEIGDIFVCSDVARLQARRYKHSIFSEIDELIIHSVCHIFGLDHKKKKDYDLMYKYEQKIISKI